MTPKMKAVIREYVESIVIAVVLAMFVRTFIVQAFKIPTGSMRMTFLEGDRILVNKFIYRFKEPERGDIIVFKYPEEPRRDFVKRLIAKAGESVKIEGGRIIINGKVLQDERLSSRYYYNRGDYGQEGMELIVPPNCYYVLGDNSASSRDSRYWGFVPRKFLRGKAFIIYWPLTRIRIVR